MGVPKTKWTADEETALLEGVRKYGTGKWRMIQKDDDLGPVLTQRSNVDLKDKWRNMHPSADGEPSPSKLSPTVKRAYTSGSLGFGRDSASKSHSGGEDSVRKTQQKRARPLQESAIYDAIRALKPGATAESIASFIEQKKQETPPPDFRKQLAHQLRLLADAGKIVKVKNLFFVAGEMPKKTAPVVGIFDGVKGTLNVEFIGYKQDDGERTAQFRINGRILTASEITAEVSKAVSEAERAAEAAVAAAREYDEAEAAAAELERAAGMHAMHPGQPQWTRAGGKPLRAAS